MKAAWYSNNGRARDVLKVSEVEKPTLKPSQVMVRIYAVGVNPSDTKARTSTPLRPGVVTVIPHQDGAGIIEAVGDGVPAARIGERVWIYEAVYASGSGCAAEYVAVPSENAVLLPDHVPFEVGACLGVPALTAHRCVFADGSVHGQTVLVTGGAGAVGSHAIQFAKHDGATVITTVSRGEQEAIAAKAGADLILDRRKDDLVARMREFTGTLDTRSVDRIIEVAFGANLGTSEKALKVNGVIATYSSDTEPVPSLPFLPMLLLNAVIRFVFVYKMSLRAHRDAIDATTKGLNEGWLQTTIAARFTLEEIADAHELSESGKAIGKIVILLP